MLYILTTLSLYGNYLNCRKKVTGFYIWIAVNTGWLLFDVISGIYSRAILDIVQSGFCIYGIVQWNNKE